MIAPPLTAFDRHLRKPHGGFSLVELMVALAIGLIVTLAVTSMIVVSQTHERVTTSANDMSQSGAFSAAIVDNSIRSAGAGYSQYWNRGAIGCKVNAKRSGTQILPLTAALPAPFAGLLGGSVGVADLRLAPVLIGQGQSAGGSDVLVATSGLTNIGDVPRRVRSYADSQLFLENTVSFQQNDVVLVTREGVADCILTQVDGGTTPFADSIGKTAIPLGGTYYSNASADGTVSLATMTLDAGGRTLLSGIGKVDNLQMQAFGVGTDNVLYRYDLLKTTDRDSAEAVAEGVVAMRALYSVNASIDKKGAASSGTWQAPSGDFAIDKLVAENPPTRIRSIIAVRVALLLRSNVRQNEQVAKESYTLLDGLPAEATINLSSTDRRFSHRVVEATIPLRPMMMRLLPPEEMK